jgi:hypothetical protein
MKKLVGIVNLSTGAIRQRSAETLTLDVPVDFDRETASASVDGERIVRYFAAGGSRRLYVGRPRELSGRVVGEECLVADDQLATDDSLSRYTLSVVDVAE